MSARFEIYQDRQGGWRWRFLDEIGCRIAYSINPYKTKDDAANSCEHMKRTAITAALHVLDSS